MLDGGREDLKRTGQKDYFQSYNSQKPEGYGSVKKLMVLKHDFLFRPTMLSNEPKGVGGERADETPM